ncbi:MAG: GTPase HflX [Clostridiales bacterium]|nr:GTPase HflX [Clostridiales bacterium]
MERLNFENEKRIKVALIAIITPEQGETETNYSLAELARLVDTAGGEAVIWLTQTKQRPDTALFLGSGKCCELKELCQNEEIELVVADAELTPSQIRNLEDEVGVRVIDRSMLILDIFALHATTAEGKLQVELAQLKYTAPRLMGKGKELSRLGGGIGTRGPGESKLESDRRHLRRRMAVLEEKLKELERVRAVQRKQRERAGLFKIAIAGYTNAGKSTLMNRLTDAGVLEEDKLFATLDPTTRKFSFPSGTTVLLTDTVGFIRHLPHHLIKAFASTLDEAAGADGLLVIVDASDPQCHTHIEITNTLLSDLGAANKPILYVFNKCDVLTQLMPEQKEDCLFISAKTGLHLDKLIEKMEQMALGGKTKVCYLFPPADAGAMHKLYENGAVESVDYTEEGAVVLAVVDEKIKGMYSRWEK